MSRILEAINQLAKEAYPPGWNNPAIKKYIETGDETTLKLIPALRDSSTAELTGSLPDPDAWTDESTRLLTLAQAKGLRSLLKNWIERFCRYGSADWGHFSSAVECLSAAGLSDSEVRGLLMECDVWDVKTRQPTEAGQLVLQGTDAELLAGIKATFYGKWQIPALMAAAAPDRLEAFFRNGLVFNDSTGVYGTIARANPARFAKKAFEICQGLQNSGERVRLAMQLAEADPTAYLEFACEEVRAFLGRDVADDDVTSRVCAEFLLQHRAPDALEFICRWMANFHPWNSPFLREMILKTAREHHAVMVRPMAQACARCQAPNVVLLGLKWWREEGIGDAAEAYHDAVKRLLAHPDPAAVRSGISEARAFDLSRTQNDLWPLMQHKSRPVRGAAARALAGLGYADASGKALKLLEHKKAEVRQAAVILLSQTAAPEALQDLKQRLDVEENDDVRDDILLALERAGTGAALSPEEQQTRIAKTLSKAKAAPATWIDAGALSFQRVGGAVLSTDEVLYLLIRQSRCKEMRADLEAKPLYATLDRAACADSALALLQAFLGSPQDTADRWALVVAALTGDDRLVPVLRKAILDWADNHRGKLAEYAAQALALLGTEAALMVVDSLSVRFRSKNKNIGKAAAEAFAAAAEARGVTVEELGDLVVPWLGFEPGKPRLIETSKGQVEARIDAELNFAFRDVKSGKVLPKLPAGASAEVQAEFRTLAATLKEAAKAQTLRIETLLVRQFRWPVDRWRQLYLAHPLLRPFAQRLVWGWRDASGDLRITFRALDDATLSDVKDNPVTLPAEGSVSLVHPLDLDDETRAAWIQHFVDYDVTPPFSYLDRPVIRCQPEASGTKFGKQVNGAQVNAMTFRGRAEKLGWSRGSVCDGGGVTAYRKIYSGAGVDAFLGLEGLYIGIGMDETITLRDVYFVRTGSVQVGSYVYDEPSKDDDPRLIPFADVPVVPFSETMGDLAKIVGRVGNSPEGENATPP